MPTAPKPPGQRRRRNAEAPKWRVLEASGGKAPKLPTARAGKPWLKGTKQAWATIWSSAVAVMWVDADMPALHRWAYLTEAFNRGELGSAAELRQLDDRLGLSPRSRRLLQWEIGQASKPGEPEGEEPEAPAPARASRRTAGGDRLRAV